MSETAQAVEAQPVDDLRSVLDAAYDAHSTAETQTESSSSRVRDEHGRFTAREQTEHTEAETDTTDQPETTVSEPENPVITPPQSWSDAEKAHWANLSREAQETILRRERDYDKGLAERADELKSVASLREVLAPYQAKHAMMGMDGAEAVRRLLAAQEALERDPDRAFPELMRAFGYDPRRLGIQPTQPQPNQPQPQQFRDPRVDDLLRNMQTQQHQSALAEVESFGNNAAHPHFNDVRNHMGALLNAGTARNLQDAYDQAIWAVPGVREKMLAERTAAAEAQSRQAAREKAEAARRASVSVRDNASPSGGAQQAAAKTVREELERAWEA